MIWDGEPSKRPEGGKKGERSLLTGSAKKKFR